MKSGGESTTCCPFDPTDVDYVASISFNYGLSLMDISQVDIYFLIAIKIRW